MAGSCLNKYEEFTDFCQKQGVKNEATELHGNRFGDLESCSAIGVYLVTTWISFIDSYPNIRNQLTIFLRSTSHLSDICRFLWLGAALFGLHVTYPYMNMLIDMKVDHLQLLEILPSMYNELVEYPTSLAQIDTPGLPSLSFAWLNPFEKESSPYGKDIAVSLSEAIQCCDLYLLDKYLRELCYYEGFVLKRQRGNAYGFGPDPDSSEHVLKQLSSEELQQAPTHTKPIENLYGVEDMILTRFGPQSFNKSQDDLVIRYSSDLLDKSHSWSSKRMRKLTRKLDEKQIEFTNKQKDLVSAGVKPSDAVLLTNENKIQRVVEQCRKSHGGPIATEEELDDFVKLLYNDEKLLRKALMYEIRYRKFTYLNIKDSNPLFAQMKLTNDQMICNLRMLINNMALCLKSSVTMEDLKTAIENDEAPSIEAIAPISEATTPIPEATAPIPDVTAPIPEATSSSPKATTSIPEATTRSPETNADPMTVENADVNSIGPVLWPPKIQDHILINFDDGFRICEVVEVSRSKHDRVKVELMQPKRIRTATITKPREFWTWPAKRTTDWVHMESVLPVYPVLELAVPPSTRKCIVFQLHNLDIIEKLADL